VLRIRGDDGGGQIQVVQQRPEPGDLIGGGVHVDLTQDSVAGVVHRREQVHRRGGVVAAATQDLAVDRDRPLWPGRRRWWPAVGTEWLLAGQPSADDLVQRVRVDAAQHGGARSPRWAA
jgi:hypothetical protein